MLIFMRPDMSLDALPSLPSEKWSDVMEKKIWLGICREAGHENH